METKPLNKRCAVSARKPEDMAGHVPEELPLCCAKEDGRIGQLSFAAARNRRPLKEGCVRIVMRRLDIPQMKKYNVCVMV